MSERQPGGYRRVEIRRRRRFGESGRHPSAVLVTAGFGKGWWWTCACGVASSSVRRAWAEAAWRDHRDRAYAADRGSS